MTDRLHQAAMRRIARKIAAGNPVKKIIASVTPGGGKSALPGILAAELMPDDVIDRIAWVVPRNSLRAQGEGDFPGWSQGRRIRAAGNEADPCRGTHGYVTTYQAIVANPARHLETFSRGRWALFIDEPHHCQGGGEWGSAIAPLIARARIVVYASGTFARGDGQPIAGIGYDAAGMPDFDAPDTAVVRYSRGDALREGAIVSVHFRHLDGSAEWEDDEGERQASASLRADYSPAALFTALRTEYAFELLDETVADWRRHRREAYPQAKLLVVAPNIAVAHQYFEHLHRRRIEALVATSDDDASAQIAIARFKGQAAPAVDVLVTVAMAYEGMSVPDVTHIACLTHIRSVPWLEQCFARANRTAPGKGSGFVFGPDDVRLRAAIASIEAEQAQALAEAPTSTDSLPIEDGEGGSGGGKPGIRPIGSAVLGAGAGQAEFQEEPAAERPDGGLTPSQAQALLRTQIARHIKIYLSGVHPGSKGPMEKIIMRKLKDLVGGKAREDCTVEELTAQWAELRKIWPLKN